MAKKEKLKIPGFFYTLPGIVIVALQFFNADDTWSIINTIKVGIGLLMIGYGIYTAIKNKSDHKKDKLKTEL